MGGFDGRMRAFRITQATCCVCRCRTFDGFEYTARISRQRRSPSNGS